MSDELVKTRVFGYDVEFPYAKRGVGYALVATRLVMGWILFWGGLSKIVDPSWSAAGYLANAVHPSNPFVEVFASMAGSALVDWLVMLGLLLTGLGLLLGVATRLCAFFASIMMLLFWAAALQGGLLAFLPLEHGFVINEHVLYVMVLWGLSAFGAGQILGVDGWLRKKAFVQERAWLRYVLG